MNIFYENVSSGEAPRSYVSLTSCLNHSAAVRVHKLPCSSFIDLFATGLLSFGLQTEIMKMIKNTSLHGIQPGA